MDDDTDDDDDDGWPSHCHDDDLSSYSHGDFGPVFFDAMECSTRTVVDDDTEDDTSIQRNSNRNDRGSIVWLV